MSMMEAIALFLRHYQGYTFQTALNEYAIRFYTMLEWALRHDARDTMRMMDATLFPHLKPDQAKKLRRQYQLAGATIKAQAKSVPDVETEKANIKRIQGILGQ